MRQIYLIGDCHLSPTIWKARRDIHGDSWRALNKAVTAIAGSAGEVDGETAVIFGGDVFDGVSPDAMSEKMLKTFVERLEEAGAEVWGVQGNHDKTVDYPRISVFGIRRLTTKPVDILGRTVCGLDACGSAAELRERLKGSPECDYLVMHAPFKHLMSLEGRWQVEAQDVPATVKTVLVGDVHKASIVSHKRPDAGPLKIISPGSTHPRRAQEFGRAFGFVKILVNDDGEDEIKYVRIPGRTFLRLALGSTELNETLSSLEETGDENRPVIQVKHAATDVDKFDEIVERHGDKAFFISKVQAGDYVFADESTGSEDEEELSLRDALEETCGNEPVRIKEALAQMLSPGSDPRGVLSGYAEQQEVRLR